MLILQKQALRIPRALLAGLLLAGLLILFYGGIIFSGHYIFTGTIQDITNIYGFFPWDTHSIREFYRGHFPLWNPYNGLGVPHLANMQSGLFFPMNLLKYIFGFWATIDLVLLIRLWLAGFFSYLLARRVMGVGFFPGILAGSAYMLSGYLTRYVYMSHLNVEALLPLQLWLFHRLAERPRAGRFILAAAGVFLLVAGGFPEACLYALSISSLFYLFCGLVLFRSKKSLIRSSGIHLCLLIGVLALGLILSLPQWLPFAEYLAQAWTYHQPGDGLRHLDFWYCISLVLPWFFGQNWLSTLVPFLAPCLGLVAVLFALRACMELRARGSIIFFLALAIILLSLIYGIPPFNLIGHVFPFNLTYNYKYSQPGLALCVSLLAAFGLEVFSKETDTRKSRVAGLVIFIWAAGNLILAILDRFSPFYGFEARAGIIQVGAVLFALGVLKLFHIRYRWPKAVFQAAVLAIAVIALIPDFTGRRPQFNTAFFAELDEGRKLSELSSEPYRFCAEGDIFFPGLLLCVPGFDLRSYDPLYPRSYVEYMSMLNHLKREGSEGGEAVRSHYDEHMLFQVDREHAGSPLASLANLKLYAVTDELSSLPLIAPLPEDTEELGPFAGWSRVVLIPIMNSPRKALIQHAPGLIRIPLSSQEGSGFIGIAFFAGLPEKARRVWRTGEKSEGSGGQDREDGASMILFLDSSGSLGEGVPKGLDDLDNLENRRRLVYARHISPVARAEESRWFDVQRAWMKDNPLSQAASPVWLELAALPGPYNLHEADLAAWGQLRLKHRPAHSEFVRLNPASESPGFYQNTKAFPRAFLVNGSAVLTGLTRAEKLDNLARLIEKWDQVFHYQVLLTKDISPEVSDERKPEFRSRVRITEYTSDRIKVSCRSPGPGFLVLSDQYFPGWRAWRDRDEKEIEIYQADIALRAVAIEAGESLITFRYMPWSFRIGLFAALASILAMITLSIFYRRFSRYEADAEKKIIYPQITQVSNIVLKH